MDRKKSLFGSNYRTHRDDILRRARGEVSGYTNDMADMKTELEKDQEPETMSSAEVESIFQKGMKYYNGDGVKENKYEAFQLFKTAAENGHAEAQFAVATFYNWGEENVVEEDVNEEIKWLKLAADNGNAKAQCALGCHYRSGEGVDEDEQLALRYLNMSADNGCLDGMYELAFSYFLDYLNEKTTRDNNNKCLSILKMAAQKGHCPSQGLLGEIYTNGWCDVKEDSREAFRWTKKAAENKRTHPESIRSISMALDWWKSHRDAMYDLGRYYFWGDDVEEDYDEAFKWFKEAALADHRKAQGMLALCYYLGRGVSEDNETAEKVMKMARDEATDSDDIEYINKIIELINKDGIIYIEPKHS